MYYIDYVITGNNNDRSGDMDKTLLLVIGSILLYFGMIYWILYCHHKKQKKKDRLLLAQFRMLNHSATESDWRIINNID